MILHQQDGISVGKRRARSLSGYMKKRVDEINQHFIERHITRMEKTRVQKIYKKVEQDLKPGSGKIWKNELTKPSVPKITGLRESEEGDEMYEPMII